MRRIAVLTFLFTLFLLMGCSKGDSLLISSGKPASSNQLSEPVSSTSELVDPIELLKTISFDTSEDEIVSTCVSDINNDSIPEIILRSADGRNYQIYYYTNGSIQQVENLSAWTFSSCLLTSPSGYVVLSVESHTTGTAGLLQYRVFHWDGTEYTLTADLCRTPAQWDTKGNPIAYQYFSSNVCIDLEQTEYNKLADFCDTITAKEFDAQIESLGTLTPLTLKPYELETNSKSLSEYLKTELDSWADQKDETSYYLPLPTFIDVPATAYCTIAQDYLHLTEEEFSNQYSAKQLWKAGAYDRLLFTSATKGPIIEDISIGDSLEKIENHFGKSQFSTESEYDPNATNYQRFLLYGYKTKTCYFVFQIAPDTQKVQSICLKKRFPLPQNKHDVLLKLSAEHSDWYTWETNSTEWNTYLEETAVSAYTQLSRGTMTLISDYGFLSTSGMGDFYDVFADFEGKIPKLPTRPSAYHDNSCEQPVSLRKTDYPEQLIYNVYDYLAEGEFASEEKTEVLSPSGTISVTPRDQNPLSMSTNSSLYENAHLVFHWKDGSQPDRQVYMGHFSTILGFINERYLVESNLFGLHIYDILSENIVHYDFDLSEEYSTNLLIDSERSVIVDERGTICYRYQFAENGDLQIVKSRE